jgi:hypothetical protein
MPSKPIDRPISFTALMARAILDGRKTQTHRIVTEPKACPFGAAGDHLWVREPFTLVDGKITYAADLTDRSGLRWRASYLMQRDASRATVEIISIRKERLRKISKRDAIAEGCPVDRELDPVEWFIELWGRIATKPGEKFDDNPRVWVIEFCLITSRQA